jgi:hypothetical protein
MKKINLTIKMEWVQLICARLAKDCYECLKTTERLKDKTYNDVEYVRERADFSYECIDPKQAKEFGLNVTLGFTKEEYINTVLFMYHNRRFNIPYLNTWNNLLEHLN